MSDLISRQAAIDAIDRLDIPEDMCVFEILSHIELEIGTLPSAQPERKNAWINVHDAMPEERESIFAKYKGTAKWQKSFWEKQSDIVLVAIACKDGYKFVTTARTVDAVWSCDHLAIRGSKVIAWQPLPEPPEE